MLIIEPTPTTPKVHFDPNQGYLEISGKSLPENTYEFFQPIQDWLDSYIVKPAPSTNLVFKMEYFNTSSTAQFLKVIKKLEKLVDAPVQVGVTWYYDTEDEDMKEAGEDYQGMVRVPIEIVGTEFTN